MRLRARLRVRDHYTPRSNGYGETESAKPSAAQGEHLSDTVGIGFDSGGTRTSYAVWTENGSAHAGSEIGSSISTARTEVSSRTAIEWIMSVIDTQAAESSSVCVWIGAAGFSAPTAESIATQFEAPLRELSTRLEERNYACEVFIANDGTSILKAPPLLGNGVGAIVGTGSVVMGAHAKYTAGVVQRSGLEWLVSDEGSGVWMTLHSVRLLLADIQTRGAKDYHSVLLDRLADYFGVAPEDTLGIPASHRALATADLVARKVSEPRHDAKRFLAGFAYPHIFDLATLEPGRPFDPIAAEVITESVRIITEHVGDVSDILAAQTSDEPNQRESLPLVVGGNIAANPHYDRLLRASIAGHCRAINSVLSIGDASDAYASLAYHYLESDPRTQSAIAKSFDPLHPVLRLL